MIEKNISGKKIYYLLMKLLLIWIVIILMILSGFPMTIKKKLKKGDKEAFKLINKEEKKI